MHSLNTRYSCEYNCRHERQGHVFSGRYDSQCIEKEQEFWNCIKYIHNHPKETGVVKEIQKYPYSSIREYLGMRSSSNLLYSEAKKNPAFDLWLPVCFRISNVSFLFSEDHKEYCCADVLATNHRVSIEKCITCKSIEEHQNMAISAMYLLYFANTLRIWRKIGIRSALFSCFLF